MIKVVGKSPEHVKQKTCWNCASMLEYTASDTFKKSSTDYTGCTDVTTMIICPSCTATIAV